MFKPRTLIKFALWLALAVAGLEFVSFLAVTALNYFVYGNIAEIQKVRYDPYAVYTLETSPFPSAGCRYADTFGDNRFVWLFGGSTLLDSTSNEASTTLASVLAGHLNSKDEKHGYVLNNYGVYGFNSLMEAKYLEKCLIEEKLKPDLVVFYDGVNDTNTFMQYRDAYGHFGMERIKGLVEANSHKYLTVLRPFIGLYYSSFTRDLVTKFMAVTVNVDPADAKLKQYVDRTEERYDYISSMLRAQGIGFVLYWQPIRWLESCPVDSHIPGEENRRFADAAAAVFKANYSTVNTALAARLRDKPYFVDVRDALCNRTERAYWDDGVHLFDAGNALVAARLSGDVLARLDTLADAERRSALVDLLEPEPKAILSGFTVVCTPGGNPFRAVEKSPARVTFAAPAAGRVLLNMTFLNLFDGQGMTIRLNGKAVDRAASMDRGHFSRLLGVDVRAGENVLELAYDDPEVRPSPWPPRSRMSILDMRVHGFPY